MFCVGGVRLCGLLGCRGVGGELGLWCGCVRRVVNAVNESGGGEGGSSFEF